MRPSAVHALFFAFFALLLEAHANMSVNGTYWITNSAFSAQRINLRGGSGVENTTVQGYGGNHHSSKWIITQRGRDVNVTLVTIRNDQSRTFINTFHEITGGEVVGSQTPGIFEIVDVDKFGVDNLSPNSESRYLIFPYNKPGNLAFHLSGGKNEDMVDLKDFGSGKPEETQMWTIIPVKAGE